MTDLTKTDRKISPQARADSANASIAEFYLKNLTKETASTLKITEQKIGNSKYPVFELKDVKADQQIYLRVIQRENSSGIEWSRDVKEWESVRKALAKDSKSKLLPILKSSDLLDSCLRTVVKTINGESSIVLPATINISTEKKIELFLLSLQEYLKEDKKIKGISDEKLLSAVVDNANKIFLGKSPESSPGFIKLNQELFKKGLLIFYYKSEKGLADLHLFKIKIESATTVTAKEMSAIFPKMVLKDSQCYFAEIIPIYNSGTGKAYGFNNGKVMGTVIEKHLIGSNIPLVFPDNIEKFVASSKDPNITQEKLISDIIKNEVAHALLNEIFGAKEKFIGLKFQEHNYQLQNGSKIIITAHNFLEFHEAVSDISSLLLSGNFLTSLRTQSYSNKELKQYSLSKLILQNAAYIATENYLNSDRNGNTNHQRNTEIDKIIKFNEKNKNASVNLDEVYKLACSNQIFCKHLQFSIQEIANLFIENDLQAIVAWSENK